jgi:hypothetical protein
MRTPIPPIYETDDEAEVIYANGDGTDVMIWVRSDTREVKARINGQVRTLFNSQGQPGTPSPAVYSAVSDAGLANGDTWYRSDLKEIRTKIDDKVFTLADVKGPAGGSVFTINYVPTETVYVYVVNPISFVP